MVAQVYVLWQLVELELVPLAAVVVALGLVYWTVVDDEIARDGEPDVHAHTWSSDSWLALELCVPLPHATISVRAFVSP